MFEGLAEVCFSFCFTIPPPQCCHNVTLERSGRGRGRGRGWLSQPPSHHHCGAASVCTRTQIHWITLLGFSAVRQVTFDLTPVSCRSSGWNSVAVLCWHTNITCTCTPTRANTTTWFDKILKQGCWCGHQVCGWVSGRDLSSITAQPNSASKQESAITGLHTNLFTRIHTHTHEPCLLQTQSH